MLASTGAYPSLGAEDEEEELVASERLSSSEREIEGTCWGGEAGGTTGVAAGGGGKGCAISNGMTM